MRGAVYFEHKPNYQDTDYSILRAAIATKNILATRN